MIYLSELGILHVDSDVFPFNLRVVKTLDTIQFSSSVTFFVGENGSGKSTILEAIAAAVGLPAIGSHSVASDETLKPARRLARALRLSWTQKTRKGFFLRAEDFFGFTKYISRLRSEMEEELRRVDEEYQDRSEYSKALAKGPFKSALYELESRYGIDLDANSHGESFLKLFESRFVPNGLYLIDEPEAPLSPQSQLGFMVMLKEMVDEGSQFIIATHSPILLAFPKASIISFDELPIKNIDYNDLEHVNLTRVFLNDPEQFFRHLFS
mgnify:CR=1 FL=1